MDIKRAVFGRRGPDKRQQRMWRVFCFLARLLVLSVPLYIIIALGISLAPLQTAAAEQSGLVLEAMGFDVLQQGAFVTVSGAEPFRFLINGDCTGWKSMLFLFALVFAVPGIALGRRLWGLVVGLAAVWLGNIVRVVGVVLAERAYGITAALMIHDYGWQLGLIALVLAVWLMWLRWAQKRQGFRQKALALWGSKWRA